MKKAAESLGFAFILLLMIIALSTFLAPHFGWRVDAVLSGSMEPELNVGGVVITRPVEANKIQVGDIITFYAPQNQKLTSHRVIASEDSSSFYFRTKGDANEEPDPAIVPYVNIVGRVCFHFPYLGYVNQSVRSFPGFLLTLCLPGLIIIVLEIRNIWYILVEEEIEKEYRLR
jgi:signal peptidase